MFLLKEICDKAAFDLLYTTDDEPVTRKRALGTLLSEDVAEQLLKRCNNTGGLSPADSAAIAAMLKVTRL